MTASTFEMYLGAGEIGRSDRAPSNQHSGPAYSRLRVAGDTPEIPRRPWPYARMVKEVTMTPRFSLIPVRRPGSDLFPLIPAQAGIQSDGKGTGRTRLDARLRGQERNGSMAPLVGITRSALIAVTLVASPMIASAQTRQAPPEANVWGGLEHQPTEAEVRQREKADDIGQTQQQRTEGNDEVEGLYNQLMKDTGKGGADDTTR